MTDIIESDDHYQVLTINLRAIKNIGQRKRSQPSNLPTF